MQNKWQVGYVLIPNDRKMKSQGIKRRIVKLEQYGEQLSYLWEYPDLPSGESNLFSSINSYDPELTDWGKEK